MKGVTTLAGAPRRVVVTGYGVVAPCGLGKAAFWGGLLGPALTGSTTVHITDWDPLPYYDSPKDARRADPCRFRAAPPCP